jgi:SAM-dependent methyltransferase
MHALSCPLCNEKNHQQAIQFQDKRNAFYCHNCFLIWVHPESFLNSDKEKERYLEHNNEETEGYRNFLQQAINPVKNELNNESLCLDYGCGPTAILSKILNENAVQCANFDPFFFPKVPQNQYDFIFATECFEHFHSPKTEIVKLHGLLKSNGKLVIMTSFWNEETKFENWYYLRDKTHVSIFHIRTFEYIAKKWGLGISFTDNKRVVVLEKL